MRTVYPLLHFAFAAICSEIQREGVHLDASALPSAAAILPHATDDITTLHVTDDGLIIVHEGSLPSAVATLPARLPWFMLASREPRFAEEAQAVDVARTTTEPRPVEPNRPGEATPPVEPAPDLAICRGAADRVKSMNNLKQIDLAMQMYNVENGKFPSATGAEGKPLLSWRVRMLPYLEQSQLYEQFHFDEPWDSEHNKPLVGKMPRIYVAPGSKVAGQFKTVYLTPRGKTRYFPLANRLA